MKIPKILIVSLVEAILMVCSVWLINYLSIDRELMNSPGAIGIIGGADGPTAIFISTKLQNNLLFTAGLATAMFIAFLGNLTAFISNKALSVLLFSLCCIAVFSGIFLSAFILPDEKLILGGICIIIVQVIGYIVSRKIINRGQ